MIKTALSKLGIIDDEEKAAGIETMQPQMTEIEEAMKAHGDWES